ncbi:MAG TPA: cobalamin biosynthesis protein CbiM [Coriobacteriia bacterium]|nr:cobalamin biosynthesis protein CbiM [Coriobacteriia bacterium]
MSMKLSLFEKRILAVSVVFAIFLSLPTPALGMHIMEGYLPIEYCVIWGVICIPFMVMGVIRLRKLSQDNPRILILLAMSGAFIFVISSLKIPSVTGSCSHMTGTGLSAVLFGPGITSILGLIVLIFQATLLAHGGLTSLGANAFSMAIAGPIIAWTLYRGFVMLRVNKLLAIGIAAALGDLLTYCVTSFQLALAYPSEVGGIMASALKFLAVFAPTQVPLAIVEGILTVLIIIGMQSFAAKEFKGTSFNFQEARQS